MRSDRPKFASNNRATGTPDENKAVVQGVTSYFGTYSVNEANKTFTIKFEGSAYPNLEGTEQTRAFTIEGDQLMVTNPSPTVGGHRHIWFINAQSSRRAATSQPVPDRPGRVSRITYGARFYNAVNVRPRNEGLRFSLATSVLGPGCVKTHTSEKCRKYNSPTWHSNVCPQHYQFSYRANF